MRWAERIALATPDLWPVAAPTSAALRSCALTASAPRALMALATRALSAWAAHRVAWGLGGSQEGHVSRCGAGAAPMLAPPVWTWAEGTALAALCPCLEAPTSAALCFSLTASTPAAPRPWGWALMARWIVGGPPLRWWPCLRWGAIHDKGAPQTSVAHALHQSSAGISEDLTIYSACNNERQLDDIINKILVIQLIRVRPLTCHLSPSPSTLPPSLSLAPLPPPRHGTRGPRTARAATWKRRNRCEVRLSQEVG